MDLLIAEGLFDFIRQFESEKQFALLVIVIGCSTGVLISLGVVVFATISEIYRYNSNQQFKREMLSMGMGADEIERVIQAEPPSEDS